jgi:AhpD family alkylhydroperoxidase
MIQNQEKTENSYVQMGIQEYKEGLGQFKEKMPDIAEKYHAFTGACFKKGAVDEKTKQLIALGISLGLQDEYCIIYHTQEALHKGASDKEILEVVAVSAAFSGGAAMSQGVTLVQECLNELPRRPQ